MTGLTPRAARLLLAAGVVFAAGCVDRRFVIETNVPGAQIDVDGVPHGPSPVDSQYLYAGTYTVTASAPGYETQRVPVRLRAKWYQYPPIDFIAEILYPGRIEDVRTVRIDLPRAEAKSEPALLSAADAVRRRGQALPPPSIPNDAGRNGPAAPRPPVVLPTAPGPNDGSAAPVTPQVPATTLPPLASPRDGDTPSLIRPPGGN